MLFAHLSRCSLRLQARPPLLPGLLLFLLCTTARLLSFAPGHVVVLFVAYRFIGVSSWVLRLEVLWREVVYVVYDVSIM